MLDQNLYFQGDEATFNYEYITNNWEGNSNLGVAPAWDIVLRDPITLVNTTVASGTGVQKVHPETKEILTGHYTVDLKIPKTSEISSNYFFRWKPIIDSVEQIQESNFSVIPEISVPPSVMREIKKVLVYPLCDEVLLNESNIKSLCIFPAMRKYFVKFPIRETQLITLSGNNIVDIPFPDLYTYFIFSAMQGDRNISMTGGVGRQSFGQSVSKRYNVSHEMRRGNYGIRGFNPSGLSEANELMRMAQQSRQNYLTYKVFINRRMVRLFAEGCSTAQIEWAKFSTNFSDIDFGLHEDVITLSQANLLYHYVDTNNIVEDNTTDIDIGVSNILSRAEDLESKVLDRWNEWQDAIILRPQ